MVWICRWDLTRRITEYHQSLNIITNEVRSALRRNLRERNHRNLSVHRWASDKLMRRTKRRRSFDGQKISDQWACWGLSFLFMSIYSVETKMGQTFMTWLILQHFLVHFCYFEAFTGRQAEPSQRRVRHTVRTEHTSPNQAWTLLQHTCGKPHTTGGHTQWTGEGYNTSQ